MAQQVTIQGASYADVPTVLLPRTPYDLITERTVACTSSFGGGYYGICAGVASYEHPAVRATIDGVTMDLPYDPDPQGYAEGYTGYGANFTSSTSINFTTYSYRVEKEDDQGNWRIYASTSGSRTVSVQALDKARFDDASVTTAEAANVTSGKIFLSREGAPTVGTAAGGNIPYCIRPDATLIKTYTFDKMVVSDLSKTIPAYSTSAATIVAAADLAETITVDYNYDYYVVERLLTIPTYNTDTKAKGRPEYVYTVGAYELLTYAGSTFQAGGKSYTSRTTAVTASGVANRIVYWTSASAISTNASATYGAYQTIQAPTWSAPTLTIKSPLIGIRGSTTYLTSTVWTTITDIRAQYVIEVWRVAHDAPTYGWMELANSMHVIECAQSATRKLT